MTPAPEIKLGVVGEVGAHVIVQDHGEGARSCFVQGSTP